MLKTFLGMGATAAIALAALVALNGPGHLSLSGSSDDQAASTVSASGDFDGDSCCSASRSLPAMIANCDSVASTTACAPEACGTESCCAGKETVATDLASTEVTTTAATSCCTDGAEARNCCSSEDVACQDSAGSVCESSGCDSDAK